MNEMQIFESDRFGQFRTTTIDGEPWFVAADVCRALEIGNPSQALTKLDDDEKMTLTSNEGHSGQRGGAQSMNVVNEPGLYTLVLGSRKPEAKAFKRWITHEVLPSIRKTGAYATDARLLEAAQLLANCKQRAALPTLIAMMSQYTGVPLTASTAADQRSGETAHVRTWIESMSIGVTDIMKSPTTELYAVYSAWAKSVDLREAVSRKAFHAILRDIYGLSQKNRQGRDGKRYFRV